MREALSIDEVKAFYDRFGTKQDSQSFYEDPALEDLIAHAGFDAARHVFEFGCGTGRLAERLLTTNLPAQATYDGVDVSTTMVDVACSRLRRFGERAHARRIDGINPFDRMRERPDRILTTYVLDLLPQEEIASFIDCSARVLDRGGRLCIASLTDGRTPFSVLISLLWRGLFRISPRIVGGCRPVHLLSFLPAADWDVLHHRVVSAFGVPSEVVVARKVGE